MVGFITQNRITFGDLICMTPGISLHTSNVDDQKYRNISEVDTDYIIVGRALYNSEDIKKAFSIGAGGVITNKPKIAYDLLVQMGKR